MQKYLNELKDKGYTIIPDVFSNAECDEILSQIEQSDTNKNTFRKSAGLFAVRQFLKEVPTTQDIIFNNNLNTIIRVLFGSDFFVTKSIYFDKPAQSNWFVSYHQDLTISVDKKLELQGYGPWTVKQNQFAVQPPLAIQENNFTVRIHLDDTDENNGALKVIPGSHQKGIYRPETIDWNNETEDICKVDKGGIMIMRPLLLHSSGRTVNSDKRRVVHIEFSNQSLPEGLNWSEYLSLRNNPPLINL
jgi:ectoine hydroxylase-related dioxygenase (phytanoyl-CoA dioxygenase family)